MKPATIGALIGLAGLLLPLAGQAAPPKARISAQQAEAAAVRKIPGRATSATYELEDGHWQYAVIVAARKGGMYEVAVSSTNGRVTSTEKTTPSEEAKEAAADKKAAAKGGTATGKN